MNHGLRVEGQTENEDVLFEFSPDQYHNLIVTYKLNGHSIGTQFYFDEEMFYIEFELDGDPDHKQFSVEFKGYSNETNTDVENHTLPDFVQKLNRKLQEIFKALSKKEINP